MKPFQHLALALAVAAFAAPASASTAYGDLNNFDCINDTGQETHGFEIEIDDVRSTDITYTYDWNHYGAPVIREDLSDPLHPKVFVRYAATLDAAGQWQAYTAVPAGPMTPTDGHACTDPSVNQGCEHFGVGYYGTPAAIRYNWLVEDPANPGTLKTGPAVAVATPTWTYSAPVLVDPALPPDPANIAQPAQVAAAIPAPELPVPAGKAFGAPVWMKMIKTTSHNADPVPLAELISDDVDADGEAEWRNNEADEVEVEWTLVQNRADGGDNVDALAPDEMGDGSEVVTRRYEFYAYNDPQPIGSGSIDGETGEAMCDAVAADDLHGAGMRTVTDANGDSYDFDCGTLEVVGNYIGAQMAAFAAAAPLGIIDHLQDGDTATAYTPRVVVAGGNTPYTISASGLPAGMSLGSWTDPDTGAVREGVLQGTPAAGGDYTVVVEATDADGTTASATLALHVAGEAPVQHALDVGKAGSGSGTVSGNGIDCGATCSVLLDAGSAVSLQATADAANRFDGWSGACSGSGRCDFTLAAASYVEALFTRLYTLDVSRTGTGSGSVSGGGINCGAVCSVTLDAGSAVVLSAMPASGSVFAGWSGACSGTGTCGIASLSANTSVSASFVPSTTKYLLSVTKSGSGAVSSSPKGINCGSVCSASFTVGRSVTLTAKPARKKLFLGWGGACSGTALTCSVTMDGARSVTAAFTP